METPARDLATGRPRPVADLALGRRELLDSRNNAQRRLEVWGDGHIERLAAAEVPGGHQPREYALPVPVDVEVVDEIQGRVAAVNESIHPPDCGLVAVVVEDDADVVGLLREAVVLVEVMHREVPARPGVSARMDLHRWRLLGAPA